MTITTSEIQKLASLSKLSISEEDIDVYTSQLNIIVDYVSQLDSVNTDGVAPLLHVMDIVNVSRPDEPKVSLTQEKALENAPESDGTFFIVPLIIKKNKWQKNR